jgi:hypothetical protein
LKRKLETAPGQELRLVVIPVLSGDHGVPARLDYTSRPGKTGNRNVDVPPGRDGAPCIGKGTVQGQGDITAAEEFAFRVIECATFNVKDMAGLNCALVNGGILRADRDVVTS